jgi:ketosteroid isomerase-like protein
MHLTINDVFDFQEVYMYGVIKPSQKVIGNLVLAGIVAIAVFFSFARAALASTERSLQVAAQDFANAFRAEDYNRIAGYMAENIVAMYPLDPVPTVGIEANRATWQAAFTIMESHPITSDQVTVSAAKDVGYSVGRWAASGVPDFGTASGRYVATWIWTKAGWKITHLSAHIHTDVPAENILGQLEIYQEIRKWLFENTLSSRHLLHCRLGLALCWYQNL